MLSMSDDSWLTNKRRGFELYESLLVTGRICPKGSSAGIVFTHGPIFGFFAPQGRLAAQIKVKFGTEERKVRSSVPNFTLIGPGVGGYGPQNWKKSNLTNIIAPKGRVPCTIFTKFINFMRVLSLHKPAKFGCFISINDKIINNLL